MRSVVRTAIERGHGRDGYSRVIDVLRPDPTAVAS
jgi:hypothetical protein